MKIRVNIDSSYIRILNAVPNSDEFDIYINGNLIIENIKYKDFSPYTPTVPGNYEVEIYRSGDKEELLYQQSLTIAGGNAGTVVITGLMPKLMILAVFEDPTEVVECGNAKFRVAHLSPTTSPVDVNVNNVRMIDEIPFGKRTNYAEVPRGIYDFLVEENEFDRIGKNKEIKISNRVEIKNQKIYTLYIVGDFPNVEIIQSLDLNTYMND